MRDVTDAATARQTRRTTGAPWGERRHFRSGVVALVVLVTAAATVAQLPGVEVNAGAAPPLMASWQPRVGPGTLPALALVALCATGRVNAWATTAPWSRLLGGAWALGLGWLVSLATVDGHRGLGSVLEDPTEYLRTARTIHDVGAMLRDFTAHVPLASPDHWPVHVAGHPPGALLLFVGLDRIGLGSPQAAGLGICVVAATTPLAVAVTARALGSEPAVRTALPFVVIGPFALWQAVSADAVFAAAAAWTVAAAALAATATTPLRRLVLIGTTGMLLAGCALLSYGLVLITVVVAGAVVATSGAGLGAARTLAAVGAVAAAGVVSFSMTGFRYWDAYLVLRQRYWDGLAAVRPAWYWLWADLAVLGVALGPVVVGALSVFVGRAARGWRRPRVRAGGGVEALVVAAVIAVLLADVSLMSKAEVERIWLFLVPWLVLATAWLPDAWRPRALAAQAGVAVILQHLFLTFW